MDSLALFQSMQGNVNPMAAYAAGSKLASDMLSIQAQQQQQVFQNLFASAQQAEQRKQFEETMAFKQEQFADESQRGWYNAKTQRDYSAARLAAQGQTGATFEPYVIQRDGYDWEVTPSAKGAPQYRRIPKGDVDEPSFDVPPGFAGTSADLARIREANAPTAATAAEAIGGPRSQGAEAVRLEQGGLSLPPTAPGLSPNPAMPQGGGEIDPMLRSSPGGPATSMSLQENPFDPVTGNLLPPNQRTNAAPAPIPQNAPAPFPPTQPSIPDASVIEAPPRQMGQPAQMATSPGQRQMGSDKVAPAQQSKGGGTPYPKGESNGWIAGDASGAVKTWTNDDGKRVVQRALRNSSGLSWQTPEVIDEDEVPDTWKVGSATLHKVPMPNGGWKWEEEPEPEKDKPLTEATVYMVERDMEKLEAEKVSLEQRLKDPVDEKTKREQFEGRFNRKATTPQDLEEGAKIYNEADLIKLDGVNKAILRRQRKLGIEDAASPTEAALSPGRRYLNMLKK